MDYLELADRLRLNELRIAEPFAEEVLCQVERILASRTFDRVQHKGRDFLSFVVARTLLGDAEQIKETTVAMAVFRESADFDPATSGKVRMAAGDLRERLSEYKAGEGRLDSIEITIPTGTYVPVIRDRRSSVAVALFDNWHPKQEQDHLCATICDDVAYRLNESGRVRAARVKTLSRETSSTMQYGLRGSVEIRGELLRVNVSLSNLADGRNVLWRSLEQSRDDVFKLTREIVDAVLAVLQAGPSPTNSVPVARRKRA